ncbi:MAG: methyl-accepting chemotaxis protein, partial [Clostridiales bacterium]|nr:methyl-accepting chemotaxis protein [Clostridiales bacterium]
GAARLLGKPVCLICAAMPMLAGVAFLLDGILAGGGSGAGGAADGGASGAAGYACAAAMLALACASVFAGAAKAAEKLAEPISIACCFAAFALTEIASPSPLAFLFIVPVLSVLAFEPDFKRLALCGALALAMVVARLRLQLLPRGAALGLPGIGDIGVGASGLGGAAEQAAEQAGALAFFCVFCAAIFAMALRARKAGLERAERDRAGESLRRQVISDILMIGSALDENSSRIFRNVDSLISSIDTSARIVREISQGVAGNSDSIQKQMFMTHNIQKLIKTARELSEDTGMASGSSTAFLSEGMDIVYRLSEKSDSVKRGNEEAAATIQQLKKMNMEVQGMASLITSISEKTNLLALNASIESARAGQAGKGFAVVSGEIRKLADQTSQSAGVITGIVEQLIEKSDQSARKMDGLLELNRDQNRLIGMTRRIMEQLREKLGQVDENTGQLDAQISSIAESNLAIVESINSINAASVENSASAQNATDVSNANLSDAEGVRGVLNQLLEIARRMDKYKALGGNSEDSGDEDGSSIA